MSLSTNYLGQELTYQFSIDREMGASYDYNNMTYLPNISENTAEIVLFLNKVSDNPSIFNHSFNIVLESLNSGEPLKVTILLKDIDENNNQPTHQESITFGERPKHIFQK